MDYQTLQQYLSRVLLTSRKLHLEFEFKLLSEVRNLSFYLASFFCSPKKTGRIHVLITHTTNFVDGLFEI